MYLYLSVARFGIWHLTLATDDVAFVYPNWPGRCWPRAEFERRYPVPWSRWALRTKVSTSLVGQYAGPPTLLRWFWLILTRRDCVSVVRNSLRQSKILVPTTIVDARSVVLWLVEHGHCTYDGCGWPAGSQGNVGRCSYRRTSAVSPDSRPKDG